MALFRRRFHDLVTRQLDLYAADNGDRLRALRAARGSHAAADAGEAEETYGDYEDQVDWAASELVALRDTYAATLDEETAAAYRRAFGRLARRRYPVLGRAIADGDID